MKSFIALFLSLYCTCAKADWFCTEASSVRSGSTISACGRAKSSSETEARDLALTNAFHEFDAVCEKSDDCQGHKTDVDPKRTECRKNDDGYECVRLIEVTISSDLKSSRAATSSREPSRTEGLGGKIHKGMTKKELVEAFGTPDLFIDPGNHFLILNYVNKSFCNGRCTIGLDHNEVYKFDGFKIEFTDVLETRSFWSELFH